MINKIISTIIFFCLLIALTLYLSGVTRVELGGYFMSFLRSSSQDLNDFKIAIPNIPYIPSIEEADNSFLEAVNNVVDFLNGLVDLLNFIVMVINILIQLIEFIIILIRNLINMKDQVVVDFNNSSSVVQQLLIV